MVENLTLTNCNPKAPLYYIMHYTVFLSGKPHLAWLNYKKLCIDRAVLKMKHSCALHIYSVAQFSHNKFLHKTFASCLIPWALLV